MAGLSHRTRRRMCGATARVSQSNAQARAWRARKAVAAVHCAERAADAGRTRSCRCARLSTRPDRTIRFAATSRAPGSSAGAAPLPRAASADGACVHGAAASRPQAPQRAESGAAVGSGAVKGSRAAAGSERQMTRPALNRSPAGIMAMASKSSARGWPEEVASHALCSRRWAALDSSSRSTMSSTLGRRSSVAPASQQRTGRRAGGRTGLAANGLLHAKHAVSSRSAETE